MPWPHAGTANTNSNTAWRSRLVHNLRQTDVNISLSRNMTDVSEDLNGPGQQKFYPNPREHHPHPGAESRSDRPETAFGEVWGVNRRSFRVLPNPALFD